MIDLAKHAIELLLAGKLFRDPGYFYKRLAMGICITAVVTFMASWAVSSLAVAAVMGGFLGGAVQPYLFENVKYK